MVPRILPLCWLVLSWTSQHNIVFLEGVKAALTADAAWNHGWYDEQPAKGLRSMARVYAGWGFSQALPWYLTCTHPRASLQWHYRRGSTRGEAGGVIAYVGAATTSSCAFVPYQKLIADS
jgi:hypothetical protein